MLTTARERMPLTMRLAIQPHFSVQSAFEEMKSAYSPALQVSQAYSGAGGSWCTGENSTGNFLGRDADQYEDD